MEESATPEIQEEANALIINVYGNSESQREANSPSGRVDREANASVRNEHQGRALANDITQMIKSWEPLSPPLCRNYRVPHAIRRGNEEAYTPEIISIGPFHHGDKRLKLMEELKYFNILVKESALDVENSLSTIRRMERDIRRCYEEPSMLSSDNYVKMILMDASFIIVFFLKSEVGEWKSLVSGDHLIASQRSLLISGSDIWLLENQLPFFVIEKLYNLAFPSLSFSNYPSFKELTFKFFQYLNFQGMLFDPNLQIMHFVDLLRTIFLPTSLPNRVPFESEVELLYSASQLHEAGVKFKAVSKRGLFDLKFTKGVLEIPSFRLFRNEIFFFRNLMALEQCCYLDDAYVTDYISVLDFLIDTTKDVDLLVREGILLNRARDYNVVTTWLNNLRAHHAYRGMNCDYCTLYEALNTFYERRRHKWKAILIRDYFGNPWRTITTIVAIILLVLAFIQTVSSFH